MRIRKFLSVVALAGFIACLGALMHGCPVPVFAFEGSAPVAVSNGDVSLTCADNNRILGKTSSSVTCLSDLPDDVTQNAVQLPGFTSLYAHDNGVVTYVEASGTNYLGNAKDETTVVGVGVCRSSSGCSGATLLKDFDVILSGNATVLKVGYNVISAGDRVKLDTRGAADAAANVAGGGPATTYYGCTTYNFFGWNYYCQTVIKANDNETAVGIATETVASSATEVDIIVGAKVAPIAVTGTGDISVSTSGVISYTGSAGAQVAYVKSSTAVTGAGDRYLPAIGYGTIPQSSLDYKVKTAFPSGAVTDGITCNCESAMASGKTLTIRLCKPNSADDCSSGGDDVISSCQIDDSTTTCTDSSFSGTVSLSANDVLYYYAERPASGGSGCSLYQCRFGYSQTEY